jgi:hypothetical protein
MFRKFKTLFEISLSHTQLDDDDDDDIFGFNVLHEFNTKIGKLSSFDENKLRSQTCHIGPNSLPN